MVRSLTAGGMVGWSYGHESNRSGHGRVELWPGSLTAAGIAGGPGPWRKRAIDGESALRGRDCFNPRLVTRQIRRTLARSGLL